MQNAGPIGGGSNDGTTRWSHCRRGAGAARDIPRVHALRRTHLSAAGRCQASRHPHHRRARRSERRVRGGCRGAHDRAPGCGRGHRRPGRDERAHRAQERTDGPDAAHPVRRRHGHGAQGPRRAAGHRPDVTGGVRGEVGGPHLDRGRARPDAGKGPRHRAVGRARPGVPRDPRRRALPGEPGARVVPQGSRRRERQDPGRQGARTVPQRPPVPAVPPAAHRSRSRAFRT